MTGRGAALGQLDGTATLRILVLGTGTGVGKTHVSEALVSALVRRGVETCGLKPIESGVRSTRSDQHRLRRASTFHVKHPPYAFPDPVSPHLAARRAGIAIRVSVARNWVRSHRAEVVVVETAGALLSPIGPRGTNLDLVRALLPAVLVLVAPDRLGVLHEVRAACWILREVVPELVPCVALQPVGASDASTGTNRDELVSLRIARHVIGFPRARPGAGISLDAADALLEALSRVPGPGSAIGRRLAARRTDRPTATPGTPERK